MTTITAPAEAVTGDVFLLKPGQKTALSWALGALPPGMVNPHWVPGVDPWSPAGANVVMRGSCPEQWVKTKPYANAGALVTISVWHNMPAVYRAGGYRDPETHRDTGMEVVVEEGGLARRALFNAGDGRAMVVETRNGEVVGAAGAQAAYDLGREALSTYLGLDLSRNF